MIRAFPAPGRLVHNVMDYGARGDGTTNDNVAFGLAVAQAASGGTVYFPPGTYRFNDIQVSGVSNLTLDFGAATLKVRDGLTKGTVGSLARGFLFLNCSDIIVRGGTLDGNRANVDVSGGGDN